MLANILPIFKNIAIATFSDIVKVNDTIIFDKMDGGYKADHGISGVTFDETTNTLTLNNASISSIYSSDDLIIKLVGANVVNCTVTDMRAVEVRNSLTIIGSSSDTIATLSINSTDVAIEIGAEKRLTIGDETNPSSLVTVTIQEGNRNINTTDTYIVSGGAAIYNFTEPGGGPGGPSMMTPFKIKVNGTLLIDETADPIIDSATGTGYEIEKNEYGYIMNIDTSILSSIGYIEAEGDGDLIIAPDGDLSIASNEDGNSIKSSNGRTSFFVGTEESTITLSGGVETQGTVLLSNVNIGSASIRSSKGIQCSDLNVAYSIVNIFTTGNAISGFDETNMNRTFISNHANVQIDSSDKATSNVESIEVSSGGKIIINHVNGLGTFTPKSAFWPWKDMLGTTEEELDPGYMHMPESVVCEEGTNTERKYIMTTGLGIFTLESTGKGTYNISSNIQNEDTIAEDSLVLNGRVGVISANGYKQVAGNRIYRLCYRRRQ